jgi:DNA polymerase III subunit alpha
MLHLIETYHADVNVVIDGQTLPGHCLVEDDEGLRWYLLPDAGTVEARAWAKAYASGAAGLVHPFPLRAMLTETFMERRQEAQTVFRLAPEVWTPLEHFPRYLELLSAAQAPAEPRPQGGFVQLHTHAEYSPMDGLSTIPELVETVAADGNTALALTDHGTCAGHPTLQRECEKAGLNPIFGMEAYFIDDRLFRPEKGDEEGVKRRRGYHHMILLAKDDQGLRNLWALSTEGYRDGFYHKPCIDWDSLERLHEGVIATSACLGGPISRLLLDGKDIQARQRLGRLLDIFGDDFYIEIQPSELDEQIRLNPMLISLAHDLSVPVVVAADGHYPTDADKEAHNLWLACQTGPNNEDYWHFDHSMGEAEARQRLSYLDPQAVDEAVHNTVRIAEQCTARITPKPKTPVFAKKGGHEADVQRLLDTCLTNWSKIEDKPGQEVYEARFEQEMKLLIDKDFCGYFLLVWDYVNWAKGQGILVGPGRGSGGGSLVAYLANITELDPIEYDLMFERFLTEGRTSLPDFDIDFPASRRTMLQNYLSDRHGKDHVMRVGTHLRYASKGVLSKLFSVLAEELPETSFADKKIISDLIKEAEASTAGLGLSWEELWVQQGDVLEPYRQKYPKVFQYAEILVDRLYSYGKHAAGMVVSTDEPLDDRWPMRRDEGGENLISQFEFPDLEWLWLIKLDLLTLRTLDTVQDTIDMIAARRGVQINVYDWDEELRDPQVWEEIGAGNTLGIFQIETKSGTKLCQRMKPQSISDLADVGSIVRPGPTRSGLTEAYLRRRAGDEPVSFPDPRMEAFLGKTYGCMIYQEDILNACIVLAGYGGDEADEVRKILGKKKVEQVAAAGQKFIAACVRNGMETAAAEHLWAQMAEFAKYGFNRAHATAYALVSYWTAWLKVHYPVEYLTALLTTVKKERAFEFVGEARRLGVTVLPPDINESGTGFRAVSNLEIRYGLESIKGVGEAAVADLLVGQPYTSFEDYLERKGRNANAGVTRTLAKIGAFDSLMSNRRALVERLEAEHDGSAVRCTMKLDEPLVLQIDMGPRRMDAVTNALPCSYDWDSEEPSIGKSGKKLKLKPVPKKCTRACRHYTLPTAADPDTIEPYTEEEIRNIEAEMLGGHLSSTPFDAIPADLREQFRDEAESMINGPEGLYTLAGIVTRSKPHKDRTGRKMGFLLLTTEASDIDVVVFADHWDKYSASFTVGSLAVFEVSKRFNPKRGEDGYTLASFIKI